MRLLAALATLLAVGVFGHALYLTLAGCDWSAGTAGEAAGQARSCAGQLDWKTLLALGLLLLATAGIAFGWPALAWGGALGAMVAVLVLGLTALVAHGFLMMVAALVWQLDVRRAHGQHLY